MSWEFLLGITILGGSIQTLIARVLVREKGSNPISFGIITNFLGGIVASSLLLVFMPSFNNIINVLFPVLFANFLYGIGILFSFRGLRLTEASEYIVLLSTRVFWVILASVLFYQEKFTLIHFLGSLIIIFSVYIASWRSKNFRLAKGEFFTLIAALFFGIAFATDSYILRTLDVFLYTPISFVLTSLFAGLLSPKGVVQIIPLIKSAQFPKIVFLSTLFAFTSLTYYFSLQISRSAAQVASINETRIMITVILAVIFLKERSYLWRKLFAALLCSFGVLLLR